MYVCVCVEPLRDYHKDEVFVWFMCMPCVRVCACILSRSSCVGVCAVCVCVCVCLCFQVRKHTYIYTTYIHTYRHQNQRQLLGSGSRRGIPTVKIPRNESLRAISCTVYCKLDVPKRHFHREHGDQNHGGRIHAQ
jgi:hypothetical protein